MSRAGYDGTHHAVDKMLQELGVDYLDVVLMHAPRKLAPMLVWHVYMGGSTDERPALKIGREPFGVEVLQQPLSEPGAVQEE